MITLEEYFLDKSHTPEQEAKAMDLLMRRNDLRDEYHAATGRPRDIDPDTGDEISGKKGGSGDGGFRLRGSPTSEGRLSSHEEGCGVDDSDQKNEFDAWLDQFEDGKGGNTKLAEYGLYREHPTATNTWCHLTTRAPKSGRRTFYP